MNNSKDYGALKLPTKHSKLIQRLLSQRRNKQKKQNITPPRYDDLYFDEMSKLDDEDILIYND